MPRRSPSECRDLHGEVLILRVLATWHIPVRNPAQEPGTHDHFRRFPLFLQQDRRIFWKKTGRPPGTVGPSLTGGDWVPTVSQVVWGLEQLFDPQDDDHGRNTPFHGSAKETTKKIALFEEYWCLYCTLHQKEQFLLFCSFQTPTTKESASVRHLNSSIWYFTQSSKE